MRGTVMAALVDGPYAGALARVEAVNGEPAGALWFATVAGGTRVITMPRENVTNAVLDGAWERWRLYLRAEKQPRARDGVWLYRLPTGDPS